MPETLAGNFGAVARQLFPDLYQLIAEWDQLGYYDRGRLIGRVIVQVGTLFLSGAGIQRMLMQLRRARAAAQAALSARPPGLVVATSGGCAALGQAGGLAISGQTVGALANAAGVGARGVIEAAAMQGPLLAMMAARGSLRRVLGERLTWLEQQRREARDVLRDAEEEGDEINAETIRENIQGLTEDIAAINRELGRGR